MSGRAAAQNFTWRKGPQDSQKHKPARQEAASNSTSSSSPSHRTDSFRRSVRMFVITMPLEISGEDVVIGNSFKIEVARRDTTCLVSNQWEKCEVAHIVTKAREDVHRLISNVYTLGN